MTKKQVSELLLDRQRAYVLAFDGVTGKALLEDLAKFCRGNETTFHADPRVHAVLEGRREVWLRIQDHLNLSSQDLLLKYADIKPTPKSKGKSDE